MDLLEGKLFKTFIAVVEEKSFSRAADKLGYVQSTVTSHIKTLEQNYNKRLFHRLSRGVQPTNEGYKLIRYAYELINLGELIEGAMQDSNGIAGSINIRMIESFFLFRIEPLIKQFLKNNPMINLKIDTGFQNDIVENVLQFSVDIGIVPQDPKREDILFYPITDEELVFIGTGDIYNDVLENGLDILNNKTLISYGPICIYHVKAIDILYNHDICPRDIIEVSSIEMIKKSVMCGLGYGLVPNSSIRDEVASNEINILPIKINDLFMHGFIVNRDRDLSAADKTFISAIINEFTKTDNIISMVK